MSGHSRVAKPDLIRLARALGDEHADELDGETIATIFGRCIERAEELSAPAPAYLMESKYCDSLPHPIVRDWARRVIEGAVEHVLSCRMGDNEAERFAAGWVDSAVRRHAAIDPATCAHTLKLGRCLRCGMRPPGGGPSVDDVIELMHREPLPARVGHVRELLEAEPGRAERHGPECNDPSCQRAGGCERHAMDAADRESHRQNAEQWAKTRGSKGGAIST